MADTNWLKIGGLFIGLGVSAYVFYWIASEMRKEISNETANLKRDFQYATGIKL